MKKYFVEFYYPGVLFTETDVVPIPRKSVKLVMEMASKLKTIPFGFSFLTKAKGRDGKFDVIISKSNHTYYLGGEILTLKEAVKENKKRNGEYDILISNMMTNNIDKVIVNRNSFRVILPLKKKDVILDFVKE